LELKLRQRVIGGVVLAALAVIFLPLLFKSSGPKHKQVNMQASIPQAPAKPGSQDVMTMQGNDLNQGSPQAVESTTATTMAPISQMTEVAAPASANAKPIAQNNSQPANTQETPNQLAFGNKPLTQKPAATTPAANAQTVKQPAATTLASNNATPAATSNEVELTSPIVSDSDIANEQPQKHAKQATAKAAHTTTKHAPTPVAHKTTVAKKTTPAANKLPHASAWVVQLGSFGDTQRAKLLVKQLRAQGYKAYTRQTKTSKGTAMTRVFVGPEVKRAKAEAIQAKLNKDVKTKGVVVAYSPTQVK